jgi:hypothetical protein
LVLVSAACDTVSDVIVDQIGTTQLYFIDSNLQPQSVTDPGSTIQAVGLVVGSADLLIRDQEADLRFYDVAASAEDNRCDFVDSFRTLTSVFGKCGSGIVIDADEVNAVEVTVRLSGAVTVVRAAPPPFREDYDADGITNDQDVCPFVPDPDQTDSNEDGIGNACTYTSGGIAYLDSDGDGIRDSTDNCIWRYNPDQEDLGGILKSIDTDSLDGVGDACDEDVLIASASVTDLELGPVELLQPQNAKSYLIVDLRSDESLSCDFGAGTCTLDPSKIRFCVGTSLTDALAGCADDV